MGYRRDEVIDKYRKIGGILDALKAVQAEEGYLSDDAIIDVARAYDKFPSEVYETATFYTMLSVGKKPDHIIEVCGSTCCDAEGAKGVMNAVSAELGIGPGEATSDNRWLFRRCECLGRCDTAPNVMVDGNLITNAAADQVIEAIRKAGE